MPKHVVESSRISRCFDWIYGNSDLNSWVLFVIRSFSYSR